MSETPRMDAMRAAMQACFEFLESGLRTPLEQSEQEQALRDLEITIGLSLEAIDGVPE